MLFVGHPRVHRVCKLYEVVLFLIYERCWWDPVAAKTVGTNDCSGMRRPPHYEIGVISLNHSSSQYQLLTPPGLQAKSWY